MQKRRATIVAGLCFGDEGKGTTVDFLARKGGVSAIVRYAGGSQPAHNVVTPDGRQHTFRQFGSGTFVPGMRTHLSRFVLLDPFELMDEAVRLKNLGIHSPLERLAIDEQVVIITPFHRSANALREILRGEHAHGTCGMGVGEARSHSLDFPGDAIRAMDFRNKRTLLRKLVCMQERFLVEFGPRFDALPSKAIQHYASCSDSKFPFYLSKELWRFSQLLTVCSGDHLRTLAKAGNLLFEGAQGVLLDEWYGFHPHTTWSTTTFNNAETLLSEIGYDGDVQKLGVMRAYYTRHGAGPLVTEDALLTQLLPDSHNGNTGWQGVFRIGWFDSVMARYALSVCGGADSLALTNLDRFSLMDSRKMCTAYRFDGSKLSQEEERLLLDVSYSERRAYVFAGGIKKKQVLTDLAYQEALTRLLAKATPSYETIRGNAENDLRAIEEQLGVPVLLASYGPTAGEKRMRTNVRSVVAA